MKMPVRREGDPKAQDNSGSLCGGVPHLTQAGYNPEWNVVCRLDTLLAIRRQDVCPICLREIEALKKKGKLGTRLSNVK